MLLLSCSAGWKQLLVSMLRVQSNDKPGEWAQNNQIPAHVHCFINKKQQNNKILLIGNNIITNYIYLILVLQQLHKLKCT